MFLTYDAAIDAWDFVVHMRLEDDETLDAWQRELAVLSKQFGGRKVDILIDISHVHIEPHLAPRYGQFVTVFAAEHAQRLLRYGAPDEESRRRMQLSAIANRYAANLFASREEAVEALLQMRAKK
jgi:hypothetical protein